MTQEFPSTSLSNRRNFQSNERIEDVKRQKSPKVVLRKLQANTNTPCLNRFNCASLRASHRAGCKGTEGSGGTEVKISRRGYCSNTYRGHASKL